MQIIPKDRLNAEDVRELTERLLREQLSLRTEGYKITTGMVLNVLLKAAIEKRSIEAVCADLADVVDGNTLREAVNRALTVEDLRQHEAEFNAALAACIPQEMPRRSLEMVIDFHDEPYYGKTEALQGYTCRGEAHEGTTHFWRIASLYVIWRGVRITLALTYVLPKESTLTILQRLLKGQGGQRRDTRFMPWAETLPHPLYLYRRHDSGLGYRPHAQKGQENKQASTRVVGLCPDSPGLVSEESPAALSSSFWYRIVLPPTGSGACPHQLAQCGVALFLSGPRLITAQYLDLSALPVYTGYRFWPVSAGFEPFSFGPLYCLFTARYRTNLRNYYVDSYLRLVMQTIVHCTLYFTVHRRNAWT